MRSPRDASPAWHGRCYSRHHGSAFCFLQPLSEVVMKDLVFVAVTAAFFALAWIYTKSFDRL
jgi:hypothetical protein